VTVEAFFIRLLLQRIDQELTFGPAAHQTAPLVYWLSTQRIKGVKDHDSVTGGASMFVGYLFSSFLSTFNFIFVNDLFLSVQMVSVDEPCISTGGS